ncbi:MAG TPA: hypothetical protein VGN34_26855 [Ktedonobacteraceae bacterium]
MSKWKDAKESTINTMLPIVNMTKSAPGLRAALVFDERGAEIIFNPDAPMTRWQKQRVGIDTLDAALTTHNLNDGNWI